MEQGIPEFYAGGYAPTISVSLHKVPQGTYIEGTPWKLASDLWVELLAEGPHYIALSRLVDEHGIGNTPEEAIRDLLVSLVEYLASLEERQKRLAEPLTKHLHILGDLLARQ